MKFIFFIIVLFIANISIGQAPEKKQINGHGYVWRLDGEKLKWKELKTELKTVPAAVPYITKANTQRTISMVSYFTGLGLVLLGRTNNNTYPDKNKNGFKIGAIVILSTGIVVTIASTKNVRRGVNLYNQY